MTRDHWLKLLTSRAFCDACHYAYAKEVLPALLACADWFEDSDEADRDTVAAALRWFAAHQRWPYRPAHETHLFVFDESQFVGKACRHYDEIPTELFKALATIGYEGNPSALHVKRQDLGKFLINFGTALLTPKENPTDATHE